MAINEKPDLENKVEAIFFLRAFALLFVVYYHFWQLSWINLNFPLFGKYINLTMFAANGYLGVEFFIFISGFGLFYTYAQKMFSNEPLPELKRFIQRRALKILPSYYLALVIIIIFFNPGFESFQQGLKHFLTHIFFIHNLWNDTYGSIIGAAWMLGPMLQLYFLFPIICMGMTKSPVLTTISLSAFAIGYRYICKIFWIQDLNMLISQMPGFLDIFVLGMFTAYLLVFLKTKYPAFDKLKIVFTILSLISIILLLNIFKIADTMRTRENGIGFYQIDYRFYIGLILLFTVISISFSNKIFKNIIGNKIFIFIGTISFNYYIWHQFIGVKIREIIYKMGADGKVQLGTNANNLISDSPIQAPYFITIILVSLLVSIILTYGFEKPFAKYGPGFIPRALKELGQKIFRKSKK